MKRKRWTYTVYYANRGYGSPHISPRLDTMIDREIKEKYV